jgi:biotin carboxyl carrier protein
MSNGQYNEKEVRSQTRRILQLMNQYSLMEIEYEDKDTDQSIKLRRDSQESSPPLLEGRTEVLPGQVRSPTVGKLEWDAQDGDQVGRGDVIAKIVKQDETIPVKAPRGGRLADLIDKDVVEFGDTIARVHQPGSDEENEDS